MKKSIFFLILIFVLCCVAVFTVACKDKSVTVSLYDGDTLLQTVEITKGENGEFTAPAKDGYAFIGWFTDKEYTQAYGGGEITDNLSLFAKYSLQTVTVTFKAEGFPDIVKVLTSGSSLTDIPAVPKKDGYDGVWERTTFNKLDFSITVNAVYSRYYIVTFKSGLTLSTINELKITGDTISDNDVPTPTAVEGYTAEWEAFSKENVSSDFTVNAVYTRITFTVAFNAVLASENFSFASQSTVNYGDAFLDEQIPEAPNLYGYSVTWEQADLYSIKRNVVVNAIFTPNLYTVTFDAKDADDNFITRTVPYKTIITDAPPLGDIPTELLDERRFGNFRWGNANTDVYAPIISDSSFAMKYDSYFYVTLNLDKTACPEAAFSNDSAFVDGEETRCLANTDLSKFSPIAPNGYKFIGWSVELPSALSADVSATASWKKLFFEVSFPVIAGINFEHSYTDPLPYGAVLTFEINTEAEISAVQCNGVALEADEHGVYSLTVTENSNVAVATTELSVFNATFYVNDEYTTTNVTQGQRITALPSVDLPEGSFSYHWNNTVGNTVDFDTYVINENAVFTCEFLYLRFNVAFIAEGNGAFTDEVLYSDAGYSFRTPVGLTTGRFGGWYFDEACTNAATEAAVVLRAKYTVLYAKILPFENYSHDIIGIWNTETLAFIFQTNGVLAIRNGSAYYEAAYDIDDEQNVSFFGKPITLTSTLMTYDGKEFTRNDNAYFVIIDGNSYLMDDGFVVPTKYDENYYWYYDVNYNERAYMDTPKAEYMVNRSYTLYYSTIKYFTVNFDAMGGSLSDGAATMRYGIADTEMFGSEFPTAQLDGKYFRGWTLADGITSARVTFLPQFDDDEVTVYAHYSDFEHSTGSLDCIYRRAEGDTLTYVIFRDGKYFIRTFSQDKLSYSIDFLYSYDGTNYTDEAGRTFVPSASSLTMTLPGSETNSEFTAYVSNITGNSYTHTDGDNSYSLVFSGDNVTYTEREGATLSIYTIDLYAASEASEYYGVYESASGIYHIHKISLVGWSLFETDSLVGTYDGSYSNEYGDDFQVTIIIDGKANLTLIMTGSVNSSVEATLEAPINDEYRFYFYANNRRFSEKLTLDGENNLHLKLQMGLSSYADIPLTKETN